MNLLNLGHNHLPMISKSYKKYLRRAKARIRREVLELDEQEKLIKELYAGIKDSKAPEQNDQKKRTSVL